MNMHYKGQPIFGPRGPAGPDGNPLGTVISYMGMTAPADYLACDGAEYNIADYPDLAAFFREQFGTANHFGGDGETTFAVPDINMAVLYCIKAVESFPVLEEYDTDDGWHVRKWSDGYVEMVYVFDYVSVNWSSTTGGYYLNKIGGVPLPVNLVERYTDDAKLLTIGTSGVYSLKREASGGEHSTLGIRISCGTDPGSGKTYTLSISVTGRWK